MDEKAQAAPKEHQSGQSLGKVFVIVFAAALIGSYGGVSLAGFSPTGAAVAPGNGNPDIQNAPAPAPPPSSVSLAGLLDNDPVKGDPSAPVTIVEFSDFQCPFCGKFYDDTLPTVIQQYIDQGKAKLVYRDFPLSFHPQAQPAALAAECANEQSKFWEMHDKIFENQAILSDSFYKDTAASLGLNTQQFQACFDSQKYLSEVQGDLTAGSVAGVSGTPTFFIGKSNGQGQKIVGAQPVQVFQAAIDSYL